jgi:hypothetical protein
LIYYAADCGGAPPKTTGRFAHPSDATAQIVQDAHNHGVEIAPSASLRLDGIAPSGTAATRRSRSASACMVRGPQKRQAADIVAAGRTSHLPLSMSCGGAQA